MAELRWILLLLGALVLAVVYWWSKKKPRSADGTASKNDDPQMRNEPSFDESSTVSPRPTDNTEPRLDAGTSPEHDGDSLPVAEKKIISVRICAKSGTALNGLDVVKAMMDAGLMHGDFQIFHRMNAGSERPLFSIANMLEPGTFDLSKLEDMNTPGLTFFMMLPGEIDGVEIFTDMITTARQIAERLNCELLDEKGSSLSAQAAGFIKEEIIQFQHQQD